MDMIKKNKKKLYWLGQKKKYMSMGICPSDKKYIQQKIKGES